MKNFITNLKKGFANKEIRKAVFKYIGGLGLTTFGVSLMLDNMYTIGVQKAGMAVSDCLDDILTDEENKDIANRMQAYLDKESQK